MPASAKKNRPNIIIIVADDMGYSDLGCYGGEIPTPHLDALASDGVRFSQFYTTARCSPSRASLLTGLHPHQTGIGILTADDRPIGYAGQLSSENETIAEMLAPSGYATAAVGKWHLTSDVWTPNDAWPTRRGFDSFYGTLSGCGSFFDPKTLVRDETPIAEATQDPDFFYTEAITREASQRISEAATEGQPFFLYVAYTAPHWPLHAKDSDLERMRGIFDEGWDVLRTRRAKRQKTLGIVGDAARLSPRDPDTPAWGPGDAPAVADEQNGSLRSAGRVARPRRWHDSRHRTHKWCRGRHDRDLPLRQRCVPRGDPTPR